MHIIFLALLGVFLTFGSPVLAQGQNNIPRFVSLSSDKVFMRAGPGKQYPIKWIYQASGYPVEVTREFEHWRRIKDKDGYEGWVYKGLLSSKRTAVVVSQDVDRDIWITRYDEVEAQKIARVEPRAILYLKECNKRWCRGSAQGITGWIERKYLWGIYDHEIIE